MKLFHQLTPEQKDAAVHHCLEIVLRDMIENGIKLDPQNDDEKDIKEALSSALDAVSHLPTTEEKMDALMENEDANHLMHEAAEEMARACYYPDREDMVVFQDELVEEEAPQEQEKKKMLN